MLTNSSPACSSLSTAFHVPAGHQAKELTLRAPPGRISTHPSATSLELLLNLTDYLFNSVEASLWYLLKLERCNWS